jgi:ABC-type glycerol-3-phosphate transport system substrate-binding protein
MNRFQLLIMLGAAATSTIALAQGQDELPNRPITRSEVRAALAQQFKAMDSNHDGRITPDEFAAYREKQSAGGTSGALPAFAHVGSHWFEKSDANGDGVVTPAEAAARPLKMFDMADSNQDGVISLKERNIALSMMSLGKKSHGDGEAR